MAIAAGEPAPEFSLARAEGAPFTRADLLGRTTVLVFYPFAFSRVCTDQLSLYDELRTSSRPAARRSTASRATPSTPSRRSASSSGVNIEQLSDFEPKGAACRAFDVLHPGGFPQRALVLVGPDGVVKWSHQAGSPSELPGANLIFDALDEA